MTVSLALYVDNNNVVELSGLTNSITDVVDTGAAVDVTIKDRLGVDVSGETWPVAMTHVAGGLYRATMKDDLPLTAKDVYTVVVHAVGSGGEIGHWECTMKAQVRGCS